MNVLVTGGTGFVGSHLCEELAARGNEVTALARHPEEADFERDVETVEGDVTDYDSIEEHFADQDAVVQLVALSPLFQPSGGAQAHYDVHVGGTENAVRAAEEHGVDRFVQQSALGADPHGDTAYIRAKGEAEAVVEDSSLDWIVFRPSIIFGEGDEFTGFTRLVAPPYLTPLPGGGSTRFQPIFVAEFAAMQADAVEGRVTGPSAGDAGGAAGSVEAAADGGDDEDGGDDGEEPAGRGEDPHVGQTYEIAGPEVLTLADVARLAWAAKGRPVNVVPVPMALARVGLTLLGAVPGAPMGADQYRGLQFDNTTGNNAVGAFGWTETDLTTFAAYLDVSDEPS